MNAFLKTAFLPLIMVAVSCGTVKTGGKSPAPSGVNFEQHGIASYYANKFVGRKTASGEVYRHHLMTAAHPELPFGTKVTVVNKRNSKKVEVKINDRGPFVKGRIIDLSRKAAESLDIIRDGLTDVVIYAKLPAEALSKHRRINQYGKR